MTTDSAQLTAFEIETLCNVLSTYMLEVESMITAHDVPARDRENMGALKFQLGEIIAKLQVQRMSAKLY